jgi:hypothetical protein
MDILKNLKINVGYDNALIYNEDGSLLYPFPNFLKYQPYAEYHFDYKKIGDLEKSLNIKFPLVINSELNTKLNPHIYKFRAQSLVHILDNTFDTFISKTLDELIVSKEYFIYPIIIHECEFFKKNKNTKFVLSDKLINCLKNKQCKIVFLQIFEGMVGLDDMDFLILSDFANRYNLDKNQISLVTANLKTKERCNELISAGILTSEFEVFEFSYFQHSLWFHSYGRDLLNKTNQNVAKLQFNAFKDHNKNNIKKYHFLCFNRVPKIHRLMIFGELMSNEKFKDKFITSLAGNQELNSKELFYNNINFYLKAYYKYSKDKLLNFYKTYDSTKHYVYDESDLENNKATTINYNAHKNSFVNIVTESMWHLKNIFFSEKIYKPMYACQPFILFGNPHSLKKLKEMGFKTFDKWWDESYDDEVDLTKRFEKIVTIMEEISTWDANKCFEITQEMMETLEHNFNVMLDKRDLLNLYEFLSKDKTDILIKSDIKKRLI